MGWPCGHGRGQGLFSGADKWVREIRVSCGLGPVTEERARLVRIEFGSEIGPGGRLGQPRVLVWASVDSGCKKKGWACQLG